MPIDADLFKCFNECLCCCNEKLEKKRTASSIRTYCYNLCWIACRMDGFSETEIPPAEDIINYMEENQIPDKRRQSTYSSLKVLLNAKGLDAESKKFSIPLTECKRRLQSITDKQERTAKQKANWVEVACLKRHAKELRDEVTAYDKGRLWTKDEYAKAQLAFILAFHLKYPIRRDLCTVKYNEPGNTEGNNVDLQTRKVTFKQHKLTRYGKVFEFTLDRNQWRLMQLLRKQHALRGIKSGNLILGRYWKPLNPNAFTNWMVREMGKLDSCKGKRVGCLAIRHSVITHHHRNSKKLQKMKDFAYCCMHTLTTNMEYRVL